jgi:ech hydrogenase subunit A
MALWMNPGDSLSMVLMIAPVIGAAVCLAVRGRRGIAGVVAVTSAVLVLSSLSLLVLMASSSFEVIAIDAASLYPMGPVMVILDLFLTLVFLYVGWRIRSSVVLITAAANLVLAFLLDYQLDFTEATPVILIDNLSLIMVLITSIIGSIIAIYALRYMKDDPRQPRFFAATLLFLGGMNGAVLSNDMLWLFLFWDVTTLCSFLLIGHTGTAEAKAAAQRALIITLGGAVALITGAVLAWHYFGSTSLADIPVSGVEGLTLLPLALLSVAAFTKSAQLPFQSWLLGAMVAPTPVSALLHSATMVNLGVYLLLRMSPSLVTATSLNWIIALVGGVSFLVASVVAMTQSNAKRVLAWSTVGNLGLITMCVGVSSTLAITAGVILLLYHSISKALMFLSVGAAKERLGSEDIEDMQGIRITMPFVSAALFIGVLTIVLPPFGMFASKWLISEAVIAFPSLMFIIGLAFAGTVVFYFKWLGAVLAAGPGARSIRLKDDPLPRTYRWTLGVLMAGAIVLSALIGLVVQYLIGPFIEQHFTLPEGTEGLDLFSLSGELPVLLLLTLTVLVFVGLRVIMRRAPSEEIAKLYAGGEEFEFEGRSNYYLKEGTVKRAVRWSEGAGALLVATLLVVPLVLEVL